MIVLGVGLFNDGGEPVGRQRVREWYTLAAAWGPAQGESPSAFGTRLRGEPGVDVDTQHGRVFPASLPVARRVILLGMNPDGAFVYLRGNEAALGLWRIRFRDIGRHRLFLDGLREIAEYDVAAPFSPTPGVTVTNLITNPFGPHPACLCDVSFSGTYPNGGILFLPSMHGIGVPRFIHCQDTAVYRFAMDINAGTLRVFTAGGGEATGSVTFATKALVIGLVN